MCNRPLKMYHYKNAKGDQSYRFIKSVDWEPWCTKEILISCRKCRGCIADWVRSWEIRIDREMQKSPDLNWFITLTYNEKNNENKKLNYEHALKFIKNLRNRGHKLKYILAGEYGDLTKRKHFHILMLGLRLTKNELYKNNGKYPLYQNRMINKIWGKGWVTIQRATPQSVKYLTKYTTKRKTNRRKYIDIVYLNEKISMSKKIGITNLPKWDEKLLKNGGKIQRYGKLEKMDNYTKRKLYEESKVNEEVLEYREKLKEIMAKKAKEIPQEIRDLAEWRLENAEKNANLKKKK